MDNKVFTMAHVLSITSGKLFGSFDLVYEILDFMTGEALYLHALPRAGEECAPYLLEAFPFLAQIDTNGDTRENWQDVLMLAVETYGDAFMVYPIHKEDHEVIDPVEEALQMNPDIKVLKFDVSNDDDEDPSPFGNIDFRN